ncbi:hypothetical protein HBI56_059210 [Parastagonospora nodorum]|nr:hypothetical protein HBH53_122500 [Parastagonospora nodorum]KAH4002419.1 hypothetical protein HBI10_072060 [Parastagonospora nodorum]KAH4018091.1 hypothetical protein HBI13_139090 [Parastagonospora nodorum]KAH4164139.1 hypothetical protein HBH43_151420 [Parastagonospora nodorum]KAH4347226.1 hypothetical protein HBH98_090740 [Parastagonospora nodorum]
MARKISNGFTSHPASTLRTWPTHGPGLTANLDPTLRANLKDNGLTQFPLGPPNHTPEVYISSPEFKSREAENEYLRLLKDKLTLARQFVLIEIEHNSNTNRNMTHDKTAMLLAEGPIVFTLYAQECIRDLVILRSKLVECWDAGQTQYQRIRELEQNEAGDNAADLGKKLKEVTKAQGITEGRAQLVGNDHIWAWNELGSILGYLLPVGPEDHKKRYAEWLMERVFGNNLVEEDLGEEEGEEMVDG